MVTLGGAIDAYRGEFAPGIYIDPIIGIRNRLAEINLKLLHLQTSAFEQAGQIQEAIKCAHRIIAIEPLAEEAYCDLMRLYSTSGQPSAVLRQYQELQRLLKTELNEEPSESTRTLFDTLRRNGSGIPPPPPKNNLQEPESAEMQAQPLPSLFPQNHPTTVRSKVAFGILCALVLVGFITAIFYPRQCKTLRMTSSLPPSPKTIWETRIPLQPGDGDSEPTAVALAAGGIYFAITGFVQTAKNDTDFLTTLYDVNGKQKWEARYNGTGKDVDRARSVSIDGPGNIFVTGESDNGKGNGTTRLSGLDIVTVKYGFDGKQLWVARYDGPKKGEERPCRVVSTGEGGCVVAGYSWEGANPDGSPRWAAVLIAYDANGKQRWEQRLYNSEDLDCRFFDLALVGGGVVVIGHEYRRVGKALETECFLASYDIQGSLRWRRQIGICPGIDSSDPKIVTDAVGNIVVTSASHNSRNSDHGTGTDYLVAKYDVDGNIKWLQTYDGSGHIDDYVHALAVASGDSIVVTGESFSAPNDSDIATAKYGVDGERNWVHRFTGAGGYADVPNSIVAFKDAIYVTGYTSTTRSSYIGVRDIVTLTDL